MMKMIATSESPGTWAGKGLYLCAAQGLLKKCRAEGKKLTEVSAFHGYFYILYEALRQLARAPPKNKNGTRNSTLTCQILPIQK